MIATTKRASTDDAIERVTYVLVVPSLNNTVRRQFSTRDTDMQTQSSLDQSRKKGILPVSAIGHPRGVAFGLQLQLSQYSRRAEQWTMYAVEPIR